MSSARGTGRTTALMLQAIERALLSPNVWVEFFDHVPIPTHSRAEEFTAQLVDKGKRLSLQIDVRTRGKRVFVRSPIRRIKQGWQDAKSISPGS